MGVTYVLQGARDVRHLSAINPQDAINHSLPVSLPLPFLHSHATFVDVTSCYGALCFNSFDGRIVIINPINNRLKFLPPTHLSRPSSPIFFSSCAFGYDSACDDYKVVKCFTLIFEENEQLRDTQNKIEVFSLKNDSWDEIPAPPFHFKLCPLRGSAFINGTCYWLACVGNAFQILTFNLADQTFSFFPLPSTFHDEDSLCLVVTTSNGLLGVILSSRNGVSKRFQFWEHRDRSRDRWAKLYPDAYIYNVEMAINVDGCIMYLVEKTQVGLHKLVAYDWENKQMSQFDFCDNRNALRIAFCVPSPTPRLRQSKTLDFYTDEAGWNRYWRRMERRIEGG